MKVFTLVVLSLGAFAGIADAVRCYACSAYRNQPCGVDVDRTTPIKSGCSFCVVNFNKINGITKVVRICMTSTDVGLDTDESGPVGVCVTADTCSCNTDLCNANTQSALAAASGGTGRFSASNVWILGIVAVMALIMDAF
ncbi:hypothetical protein DPMN_150069 [Dreissena polymorpha]|uniref:Protein quiver n=1 Tax=Dreissena polymorpha TaxID=45954 RepID=A0A9D4FEQ2_DREPO|nr:hypothetical protein DPMN_150069 [Dreissena polymorpha]